jgi:hypothetical protein
MTWRALIAATFLAAQPALAEELTLDTGKSFAVLEAELAAISAPSNLESVALGSVSFLRAVEVTLQERYRTNAAVGDDFLFFPIPVVRLPVPSNPNPEPFEPQFFADMFEGVAADMIRARAALDAAGLTSDDKLIIDVAALWFDVDGNGSRGNGEGILDFMDTALGSGGPPGAQVQVAREGVIVHFDAADVEWLAAYTHLLSAISEVVLAFDPTDVITDVLDSGKRMVEIRGGRPTDGLGFFGPGDEVLIDTFASVYGALNRLPKQTRIAAARDHFLAMIARNRAFWRIVDAETDNTFEWIPNASQDAALGFTLPADTGAVWQGVLSDAEAVLKGELLVPHWRTYPGGGVNVDALVADPPAFDLVTWFQGAGLVPYMEQGPLVTWDSYRRFQQMFMGNGMFFMVLLN